MSWGQGCSAESPAGAEPEEFSKDRQTDRQTARSALGQEKPLLGCGSGTAWPGSSLGTQGQERAGLDRASSVS